MTCKMLDDICSVAAILNIFIKRRRSVSDISFDISNCYNIVIS